MMKIKNFLNKFKRSDSFYKRAKTPTIIQMDAAECGAVSLSIIMGYYGKFVPPEQAREACGVSRDGSKAINVIKAARKYGLEATGYGLDIDVLQELKPPFIIYWKFEHFLVVEGFTKDKVYINDPATGPRTVSYAKFDKCYTGVVLEMTPSKEFVKSGKPEASILTMLLRYLKGSSSTFAFLLGITFLLIIPTTAIAILAKIFIDQILVNNQTQWITPLFACFIISALLIFVLSWIQYYYFLRFKMRLKLVNIPNFFWRILMLPMNFFQQRSTGDIASRLDIYNKVANVLAYHVPQCFIGVLAICVYAIIMGFISWELMLITLILSSVNIFLLLFLKRKITDLGRRSAQDQGTLFGIEVNGVKIIEELRAASAEQSYFSRWAGYQAKVLTSQQRIAFYNSLLSIIPKFIVSLTIVATLTVGSLLIMNGHITVGSLIAFQILYLNFEKPLRELTELIGQLNQFKGNLVRLDDVMSFPLTEKTSTTEVTDYQPQPDSVVDMFDVSFGYSRLEAPVFENFSMHIRTGERVALVGTSGCGKSSVARLMCALSQPWTGHIYLNGKSLNSYQKKDIGDIISYVDQSIYLFEGTVRDNVSLWDSSYSDDDINHALTIACIKDTLDARGGLYFWIKERGKNLSGGQAQRIEIARAILRKPKLLILDEATSALDPVIEDQIYNNLKKLGCSLFIVAHRLSSIRDCNEIIVVDDGMIVQRGTHDILMQEPGIYQQLTRLE